MQQIDWDDLRLLLALSRSQTFSSAGSRLDMNATTVSRRISALEETLGTQLLQKTRRTGFQFTEAGLEAIETARKTESEITRFYEGVADRDGSARGLVVVSAVPVFVNRLLVPEVGALTRNRPGVELHLIPENQNCDVAAREVDIALRLARPEDGGHELKARRIGRLSHGIYCAKACHDPDKLPWLGYLPRQKNLPQSLWLESEVARRGEKFSSLRVMDFSSIIEAIESGLGKSVLPRVIGDYDPHMKLVESTRPIEKLKRDVWIIIRADMAHLARIRAVLDWLEGLF